MANISTYLENKLLDHAFVGSSYTQPANYVALFTTAPTMPAGTGGTEVSGGSYARVQITSSQMAAAASGSKTNSVAAITFTQATGSWGTVVAVGIYDASTSGNLLIAGPLTTSQAVASGNTFSFPTSDLTITLS